MLTSISHLSKLEDHVLQSAISGIIRAINPEKIFCYGSRTATKQAWSCFLPDVHSTVCTDYDLLIIIKEKGKGNDLSHMVSKFNTATITFTTIVHSLEAVNDALLQGSFFFTTLYYNGILLYDSKNEPLVVPYERPNLIIPGTTLERYWNDRKNLSDGFFNGAVYFSSRGQNGLAFFMLHQSVEHICIALIRIYTGYRAATHQLGKFLALPENFSLYSISVFPRLTTHEITLFKVLERAYSDTRYKEGYTVSVETVTILTQQVKELLEIAGDLYYNKIKALAMKNENE